VKKTIITNPDQFCQWWNEDTNRELISLDCETTNLDYLDLELVGISICYNNRACYINFSAMGDEQDIILDDLDTRLSFSTVIMHNAVFDLKVLKKHEIHVDNIFCTLIGAQLLNENLPEHNLKYLAEWWLKVPADQIKKWEEVSGNTSSPEFADYAMNDAIWAYQLYEIESKALKKQNLEHVFYNVEMPFCFVLRDLEINGIAADKPKLEEYKNECKEVLNSLERDMLAIFGKVHTVSKDLFGGQIVDSPINFSSRPQLVDCVEQLGLEITERTDPSKTYPEGQKSVNKFTLARLKGEHEFIDLLIRYRKLSSMYNSFIGRIEDFIDSDGRVRPSYHMVRTGRLSCSEPNLQNQPNPKKEKLKFNYRKIFVSGD